MEKAFSTVDIDEDRLHEECGVFGIYDLDGSDVASYIYYGLFSLQHRGQESCGIAVTDTYGPRGKVNSYKGMGLVNEVFSTEIVENLKGNLGVGHVRYSTTGASSRENAQPLVLNYVKGTLSLAHNGNLINTKELREELAYTGAIFQTTIDSEVIAYYIARERLNCESVEKAVARVMGKIKGSYSMVVSSPRKLIGVRDPFGFRPLCIGKKDNTYIITSENCALDTIGAEFVRDVLPGEVITIDKHGLHSDTSMCPEPGKEARCVFEYIYFARPDTNFDGVSVYNSRIKAGRYLAKDHPVQADFVVGVPDSGNAAALGYSLESGIPFAQAFVKNSYVGRTFIKPSQDKRESSVNVKLNVLSEIVKDKKIIMVDDSIVRGTTCGHIVSMLKKAGAKEVHVRISSPEFLYECYFGTDVPNRTKLLAYNRTINEIAEKIGADSLGYLSIERLQETVDGLPICKGCFSGNYPMEIPRGCVEDLDK